MALDFDGATENVSWGSDASLDDIVQKTVSAWINIDTYGEASFGRIFSKEGAGATVGWSFQVSNSLGNLATIAMTDQRATTDGVWKAPTNAILLNTWYHVAFTYDNSSVANDPVFYVNGALVATTEEAPPVGVHSPDAAVSLFMGDRQDLDRNFDGRIADARIYNRLLTAAEIETINACRGRDGILSGLVLRAQLGDKGEGVVAAAGDPKDLTGVNASTQVGAPPYAADTLNRGGMGGST
jgi:hypothetical protein